MAMDVSNIFSMLPQIISMLPTIIYVTDLMFYGFFIMFFGSFALRGSRKHVPFSMKMPLMLGTGALCLMAGISFKGFLPFFSTSILAIFRIDLLIAGMFASIALLIAFRLITHDSMVYKPSELMDRLRKKVDTLEDILTKKGRHISENDAVKIATGTVKEYRVHHAKLLGNEWRIKMKKGDRECEVIIDAWDGEVKEKITNESVFTGFFRDPYKVAGLSIIVALIVSTLFFFESFPSPFDPFSSMFGISMDDFTSLADSMQNNPFAPGDMPQGCVSPLVLASYQSQLRDEQFLLDHVYDDESTKAVAERESGSVVRIMLKIDHEGREIIMAAMPDGMCYFTDGEFCSCITAGDTGDVTGPGT
jgi:hypothetical protein